MTTGKPMSDPSRFPAFVEEYFDSLFRNNPSRATALGIHDYDGDFPDLSASAHLERIEQLKKQ